MEERIRSSLPWVMNANPGLNVCYIGPNNYQGLLSMNFTFRGQAQVMADAAFITRAFNAHYDLVEACEAAEAVDAHQDACEDCENLNGLCDTGVEMAQQARKLWRAAIAKARGEAP